jgi:uncharacterized repeat protein (TIGR03803 family)
MKNVFAALIAGLVGCAFIQPVHAAPTAKFAEKVVWSFGGGTDGQTPYANPTDVNGMLYGTTASGGVTNCNGSGCGTVFSLDPSTGAEKVLYSFCSQSNCTDGAVPTAGLIDVNGTLYGTTELGGANIACGNNSGCGTVFSLDPGTGVETVLYSFCVLPNCADGVGPSAGLIEVKGMLYGTTANGGATDNGTVFSLDASKGTEKVLYSFCSQQNCADGTVPAAGLIAVNGTLYGTTPYGGGAGCGGSGCGTVFSIDPGTGAETVLHSFGGGTDGSEPFVSLIVANGELYGTTIFGGHAGCFGDGCGTVFSLDPGTGAEAVLYSFCRLKDCPDGALPRASLIDVNGTVYGTTGYGGRTGCPQTGDCGTVFSVDTTTGVETVLYKFCSRTNCADGWAPSAGLIAVKSVLYGTTTSGGSYNAGTVFALKKKR